VCEYIHIYVYIYIHIYKYIYTYIYIYIYIYIHMQISIHTCIYTHVYTYISYTANLLKDEHPKRLRTSATPLLTNRETYRFEYIFFIYSDTHLFTYFSVSWQSLRRPYLKCINMYRYKRVYVYIQIKYVHVSLYLSSISTYKLCTFFLS